MLRFIVLGLIPGTDIQISFGLFLNILAVIIVTYLFIKLLTLEINSKTSKSRSDTVNDFELISL
jgi:hypothetical protein